MVVGIRFGITESTVDGCGASNFSGVPLKLGLFLVTVCWKDLPAKVVLSFRGYGAFCLFS